MGANNYSSQAAKEAAQTTQASVTGICGDLNFDGKVDVFDAILLLQFTAGVLRANPTQEIIGDLNQDGSLSVFDAIALLRQETGQASISNCGVGGTRPDEMANLTVEEVTLLPAYPTPGEAVQVQVTVVNQSVREERSITVALLAGAERVASTQVDIPAESSETVDLPWAAPQQSGVVSLTAMVDPDGQRAEIERLDNMATLDAVVVPPPDGANLAVQELEVVSSPGEPTMLLVTVANSGNAAAQAPLVLRVEDEVVATRLAGPVEPGGVQIIEVTWPADVKVIAAEVNPRFRADEFDPSDNLFELDQRPSVDIRVEGLTFHTLQPESGQVRQLTYSFRIVNAGNEPINTSFQTRMFPGIIDPDGTRASFISIPRLEPGQVVYVSNTLLNTPQDFELTIEADVDHTVAEDNEANNTAVMNFRDPIHDIGRWVSIGPRRITSDLGAVGRFHAIAIDPTNPLIIYAGAPTGSGSAINVSGVTFTAGSGVWKTVNGGIGWQPVTDSLPTLSVRAIAIDPSVPARVYILTPDGVFRTENRGTSWEQMSGLAALNFRRVGSVLLVHPTNQDVLYLTSRDGVYRSRNHGATWEQVLGMAPDTAGASATDLVIDPSNPNQLFAGLRHESDSNIPGVYRSTDGGDSWTKLTGCPGGRLPAVSTKESIRLAMSGSTLYASHKTSSSWTIYRTTDIGCSIGGRLESLWEPGWSPEENIAKALWSGIHADPANPTVVYATGTEFWVSTNSGEEFQRSNGPHVDHHGFATEPGAPQVIYTVSDGGVYRSTDRGKAGTWEFIADGITNAEFYDITDAATAPSLVIGGTQDNGTDRYDGDSTVWRHMRGGDGATVAIDPADSQTMYSMGQYASSLMKSTNGGTNWQPFAENMPAGAACFNFHWQVHPSIPTTLLASCGSLWRNTETESPGDWQMILNPSSGSIVRSGVDPTADLYYAGSSLGELFAGPSGANWQAVFSHPSSLSFTDIEVDPDDPPTVYTTFGCGSGSDKRGRVYRLRRNSVRPTTMSALDITSDLRRDLCVRAMAVDRWDSLTIYAGTNKGVYRGRSRDGGATWFWRRYSEGLPDAVDISDLEVHPATSVMRAATLGRSAYQVNTDFPIGSLLATQGKITLLRVHDIGTGFGPPLDHLDVEVVIRLDSEPRKAFGFQLRRNEDEFARRGMLDILRDAFNNDRTVRIDYTRTGLRNGVILRITELP